MLKSKTLLLALGLAMSAGTAYASPDEYEEHYLQRGPMPFEALDLNRDGVITPEEHQAVREKRQAIRAKQGFRMRNANRPPMFEQADTNGDGSVSREEMEAFRAQRMQQRGMGMGRGPGWRY